MTEERRDPEHGSGAQLNRWALSLATRTGRVKASLSPWVQRSLEASPATAGLPLGAGRQRPTAFSERNTRALLDRIYRKVEGTRAWHPEKGPAAPLVLDRFAGEIVQRYAPLEDKYLVEAAEEGAEESDDLVLASVGGVEVGSQPRAARSVSWPAATPEIWAPPEPAPPPPAPRAQPETIRRRRDIRPMSRVEEITPGGKTPGPPSTPPGAEPEAGPAEHRAAGGEPAGQAREAGATPPAGEAVTAPEKSLPATAPEEEKAVSAETPPIQRRVEKALPERPPEIARRAPPPEETPGEAPRQPSPPTTERVAGEPEAAAPEVAGAERPPRRTPPQVQRVAEDGARTPQARMPEVATPEAVAPEAGKPGPAPLEMPLRPAPPTVQRVAEGGARTPQVRMPEAETPEKPVKAGQPEPAAPGPPGPEAEGPRAEAAPDADALDSPPRPAPPPVQPVAEDGARTPQARMTEAETPEAMMTPAPVPEKEPPEATAPEAELEMPLRSALPPVQRVAEGGARAPEARTPEAVTPQAPAPEAEPREPAPAPQTVEPEVEGPRAAPSPAPAGAEMPLHPAPLPVRRVAEGGARTPQARMPEAETPEAVTLEAGTPKAGTSEAGTPEAPKPEAGGARVEVAPEAAAQEGAGAEVPLYPAPPTVQRLAQGRARMPEAEMGVPEMAEEMAAPLPDADMPMGEPAPEAAEPDEPIVEMSLPPAAPRVQRMAEEPAPEPVVLETPEEVGAPLPDVEGPGTEPPPFQRLAEKAAPPEMPPRPATPPVQRLAEGAEPLAPSKETLQEERPPSPAPPPVQRAPEEAAPSLAAPETVEAEAGRGPERPPALPLLQKQVGLDTVIQARAEARKRLPLIKTGRASEASAAIEAPVAAEAPATLRRSGLRDQAGARPVTRLQARFEDERIAAGEELAAVPGAPPARPTPPPPRIMPLRQPVVQMMGLEAVDRSAWTEETSLGAKASLPLARPATTREAVQRQIAEGELPSARPGAHVVQRAITDEPEPGAGPPAEAEEPRVDLDDLARQVYPLIKRLLAVERERLPRFR